MYVHESSNLFFVLAVVFFIYQYQSVLVLKAYMSNVSLNVSRACVRACGRAVVVVACVRYDTVGGHHPASDRPGGRGRVELQGRPCPQPRV